VSFHGSTSLSAVRGFTVVLSEARGQGFALVSDLNAPEMPELERRITGAGLP
jgi:hypothetical protein